MNLLSIAATATLVAVAATGAWLDGRYRRLPNWLCAIGLVAGLAFGYLADGWTWAGMSLVHCLLALVVGMGLFAMRAIGGGDAKFYAALAAWFPLEQAFYLFVSVTLTGLVLTLIVWLPLRRKRPKAGLPSPADDAFAKVPYGIAIALGAVLSFVMIRT
jgi:prepilin peptidase CpaA